MQYNLPPKLIAQKPLKDRAGSRLLAVDISKGSLEDTVFSMLPSFLVPGDLLVLNNTRVFRARLKGRKAVTGGRAEIFLLKKMEENTWKALVRPGSAAVPGMRLEFKDDLYCTVVERLNHGRVFIRFNSGIDTERKLRETAQVPLPPYIKRDPEKLDDTRYQTVYASEIGAVAAPTAGLHFTPDLLTDLQEAGIDNVHVTLHVGPGTFQPLRQESLEENRLDPEEYYISAESLSAIRKTQRAGGRIVAVGTTTTRVLESIDLESGESLSDETEIFIFPPYRFRNVDALITNFHLPGSSLLCLVAAFMGYEFMMKAYQHAIDESYRFYSYGDAMLIEQESRK
ncbi:MAG: tRNA preQ1(34) S-adenosylmethionine ribosyltransferase-isomerase QueA [Candidatus Aegiribacteria sp.]|nr:tRNA preQ1(34) S-adenosylmethionine ribosyltransferase-isomerase QueA [Candidatus Aegiribacteria sp.]